MVLSHVADSRRADKGKEGSKRGNLCMSHFSQPAVLIKNGHFYGKAGKEQRNYLSEKKENQKKQHNPNQKKHFGPADGLKMTYCQQHREGSPGESLGLSRKDVSGTDTCT